MLCDYGLDFDVMEHEALKVAVAVLKCELTGSLIARGVLNGWEKNPETDDKPQS